MSHKPTEIYNALGEELKEAITELYYWQHKSTGSFFNLLYTLIHKADPKNRFKLALGYREFLMAHTMWMEAPDSDAFFRTFGFGL